MNNKIIRILMNKLQSTADPSLQYHLRALEEENSFTGKSAYAFTCLSNALTATNSLRLANAALLGEHRELLLKSARSAHGCSQHNLTALLRVINVISTHHSLSHH